MTKVLMEKPIQNATPKNCLGSRCVRRLVAKNMPITGRVVATPRRIAIARNIHRRFRSISPRRPCRYAKNNENRNRVLKTRTAERSTHPPMEYALIA